jgi:hypothetical protein
MEKYLPIGSVVMLKGGKKRIMITGYASVDLKKKDKVYDYCGCMFPEGVISTENNLLFDHNNIEKIYCLGYSDDEQKKFTNNLLKTLTDEYVKNMLDKLNKEGTI